MSTQHAEGSVGMHAHPSGMHACLSMTVRSVASTPQNTSAAMVAVPSRAAATGARTHTSRSSGGCTTPDTGLQGGCMGCVWDVLDGWATKECKAGLEALTDMALYGSIS